MTPRDSTIPSPGSAYELRSLEESLRSDRSGFGAVAVPEVAVGSHPATDQLLQDGDLGESAFLLAVPDEFAVDGDTEDSARAGYERDFAEVLPEGAEKFLRHPCCA